MLAEALAVATIVRFISGQGQDHQALAQALRLEDPTRVQSFNTNPRHIQGNLQLWSGQLSEALETHTRLRCELVDRGQEAFAPMLLVYLVQASVQEGNLSRAARLAAEARETAELLEDPAATALSLGAAALVHAHGGELELARREAVEALALLERLQWRAASIWPLWALGLVELSEGNPAGVDDVLGPLTDQLQMGGGDPCLFVFLPDELEALISLGQLDRAQGYLEPFERSSNRLHRQWAIALAARCRGALNVARGERDGAFAAFDRALAAHKRAGMPFERARTLLVAGRAYRRFKQRGRAREALDEALAVFEKVGAPTWAAKARAELERIGRPGSSGEELTETERLLAELAASGLSNQQVAERAFLSVKTVEATLTRVYRKLGVRSRVELANALRVHA